MSFVDKYNKSLMVRFGRAKKVGAKEIDIITKKIYEDVAEELNALPTEPSPKIITSTASLTPVVGTDEFIAVNALAEPMTINNPTGTAVEGQTITFKIIASGGGHTLTWGNKYTQFSAGIPNTAVDGTPMYIYTTYDAFLDLWRVINVIIEV